MTPDQAAALRAPFLNDQIESKTIAGRSMSYINHALVTDRLIQVDPAWTWEPMASSLDGTPIIDSHGGIWIRLTIGEVTRIGYGASDMHQKGSDAVKIAISDAIKNAAMRFGVGLDLWGVEPSALAETIRLSVVPEVDSDPWSQDAPPIESEEDDLFHPSCKHGLMNYKTGLSKANGKKWEGYFCATSVLSEQCTPIGMNGQPWKKS
jgi:hypothetical protein